LLEQRLRRDAIAIKLALDQRNGLGERATIALTQQLRIDRWLGIDCRH